MFYVGVLFVYEALDFASQLFGIEADKDVIQMIVLSKKHKIVCRTFFTPETGLLLDNKVVRFQKAVESFLNESFNQFTLSD